MVQQRNSKTASFICFLVLISIVGSLWFKPLVLVAFTIHCFSAVFLKPKDSFLVLMFLMSFAIVYKFPGIPTSLLTIAEVVLVCGILVKKSIKVHFVLMIMFICLYFLCRMNTEYIAIPKLIIGYLILTSFIQIYDDELGTKVIDFYSVGLILSSLLGIFKEVIPGLNTFYKDMNYEFIDGVEMIRFSGIFNDPNFFSVAVIAAIVSIIYAKRYLRYSNIKSYILLTVFSALGLFTYSKSFIIMLAAALLLEIIINWNTQNKLQTIVELFIIVILITSGSLAVLDRLLSRFEGTELLTGRESIWNAYWEVIESKSRYWWFGLGLDAPYVIKSSHNLYIEVIYYSGVVGLVLYVLGWLRIVLSEHKNKIRLLNFSLVAMVFAMHIFLCGFLDFALPFYMMLSWMIMNIDLKSKG